MFGKTGASAGPLAAKRVVQFDAALPKPAVYQDDHRDGATRNKLLNPMQLRWDASVEIRAPQVHGTRPKCMRSTSLKATPSNAKSVRITRRTDGNTNQNFRNIGVINAQGPHTHLPEDIPRQSFVTVERPKARLNNTSVVSL